MAKAVQTTKSKDGTSIAYSAIGAGPVIIFAVGAFNDRSSGAELAGALADSFTVVTYDRRGRGASGDTQPYAVEREIEDLGAVLAACGGSAGVLGFSSGCMIGLRAAVAYPGISRLALMELPSALENARPLPNYKFGERMQALIAAGKRAEAVETFQLDWVGIPKEYVEQMRHAPFRPALEAMAHTLVYEAALMGDRLEFPQAIAERVTIPTLALDGGETPWMTRTAEKLAATVRDGRHVSVPGAGHNLTPALAPVLEDFFG